MPAFVGRVEPCSRQDAVVGYTLGTRPVVAL